MDKSNWKNIFKSWTGVPVLILVVLAVVWVFTNGLPGYKTWQAKRAYDKLSEPYYNDTYGGKTPEETYDLFIDALKKGDIELASRYFVIEKQDDWLKTLNEYQKNGILLDFISELENTEKVWKKSEKSTGNSMSFTYKVTIGQGSTTIIDGQAVEIPPGDYTNETTFTKYPTEVWKIDLL